MEEIENNLQKMDTNKKIGFFEKFISGSFGLAITYWIFGGIVGVIASALISVLVDETFRYVASCLFFLYLITLLIAIWNAAKRYEGYKIWSYLAVLVVTLRIATVFFQIVHVNH